MPAYDFQRAKAEMDFMLRGFKQEIEGNNIWGVKVPLDHPLLIARGKNSLVFGLPESGVVSKSSFYNTVPPEKDPSGRGYHMLAGYASGLMEGGLERTVESLQEMGFDKKRRIFLPELREHACKVNLWHHKVVHYTLMPDLREGGKYQLQDAEEFAFGSYDFGGTLRELYGKSCEEILQACKSGSYKLTCAGHGSEENPKPAIRHMFLVQFNSQEGKLCVADLNHLIIQRKN